MDSIVLSSGHGLHIRGASGPPPWGLDEVDEARKVVEAVATHLRKLGVNVTTYHDDISTSQDENLHRIVDFHNSKTRDLDVSVHFNCYETTSEPRGCEVLYLTQEALADDLSERMAYAAGFLDRGPKYRDDLYFLNQTEVESVLVETCFVDSEADVDLYHQNFDELCKAIAAALAGEETEIGELPVEPLTTVRFIGKVSWFGGPQDTGVSPDEGLAFLYEIDEAPSLFLPNQPPGTTGLARRLNPNRHYVACRWDYDVTSKDMLADQNLMAIVRAVKTGKTFLARPADWGPHEDTDRAADMSPGLLDALGIETDDEVEILYPAPLSVYGTS